LNSTHQRQGGGAAESLRRRAARSPADCRAASLSLFRSLRLDLQSGFSLAVSKDGRAGGVHGAGARAGTVA